MEARPNDVGSAPAEALWTWAPRLLLTLAALVGALEVVPRASVLVSEIQTERAAASRLASIESLAEDRAWLRAERAKLVRRLAEMGERATTGDMLGDLDALATGATVRLTRVEPGVPITEGAQDRVPLEVDVTGRFHDIGRYVSKLEASSYRVHRLALMRSAGSQPRQGAGTLEASLELEVVRSRQPEGRDE